MRQIIWRAGMLAAALGWFSAAKAGEPGQRVIVVEQTELKAGHQVLETLPRGLPLQVQQVRGDWLSVANRRDGWVHRSAVRPLPEAIEHFSAAIRKNGKDEAALVIRGVLWQTSGDHDAAITDFTAAIQLNPRNRGAYANRAVSWKRKGEFEIALGDYNEAIRLNPHAAATWHNRGAVWLEMGQPSRAAADFAEAIRLDPDSPDNYNALAWLQATSPDVTVRNSVRALENAVRACEMTGYGRWNFLGTLAAAHAEAGDFQAAVRWERRCLEIAPPEKRPQVERRLALFEAGRAYREADHVILPVTATR